MATKEQAENAIGSSATDEAQRGTSAFVTAAEEHTDCEKLGVATEPTENETDPEEFDCSVGASNMKVDSPDTARDNTVKENGDGDGPDVLEEESVPLEVSKQDEASHDEESPEDDKIETPVPVGVGGSEESDVGKSANSETHKETLTVEKKEDSLGNSTTASTSSQDADRLLTLPMDALHGIASFMTPSEWCLKFGMISKASNAVSGEIVRRARMHGFKCGTEIAAAWKIGLHEDAKELACLYVSAGVPVYPRSLGHSLQTLLWRMQVEIRELEAKRSSGADEDTSSSFHVDPFFQSRTEFRSSEGVSPDLTYLELKALYLMQKDSEEDPPANRSISSAVGSPVQELVESRLQAAPSGPEDLPTHTNKLSLKIHEHLLNHHMQGRVCAEDQEINNLVTPPVSLSADFYHPQGRRRTHSKSGDAIRSFDRVSEGPRSAFGVAAPRFQQRNAAVDDELFEPHLHQSPFKDHPVLDLVELEVYSATSISLHRAPKVEEKKTVDWATQTRFDSYHRRLEGFLGRGDNVGFEECMLDFWDEIFPHTAGFQYFDRHTAVPRISRLQEFLTKPCPKAVGIVQCEIERVKTTSRGKGVSMKGRLFPTYEYRLFIRSRPHNPLAESAMLDDDDFVRRDTLLMVAKNKGRKHTESSGIVAISSPKKGSNNYFLHTPQQIDVDAHFNKVNSEESSGRMNPNGASHEPVLASSDTGGAMLGRLQSNFIGTEFQIFVPRFRKRAVQKSPYYAPSDDDLDYDSAVSSDNNSSRRSRFSRLSLRRSSTSGVFEEGSSRGQFVRATSSPDISQSRQGRANRRAIANTPDAQQQRMVLCEEEDGAITYTANLLGSRPRIMDVCIPKVSANGDAGVEWKRHLESCCEQDEMDMLTAFRQVLQQIENQEHNEAPEDPDNEEANAEPVDDFGLRALQNRPPWWNIELGSFVLNFGGRVSVASVKNFQLCDRDDQEKILLQFGRIQGRHSFTMDFQHPLTPVQAFSVAISSLQSKISFG